VQSGRAWLARDPFEPFPLRNLSVDAATGRVSFLSPLFPAPPSDGSDKYPSKGVVSLFADDLLWAETKIGDPRSLWARGPNWCAGR
jgi:hypothetical protein